MYILGDNFFFVFYVGVMNFLYFFRCVFELRKMNIVVLNILMIFEIC